jgi:hypothetical protein
MLEMLRDLVAHKGYADAALLKAVGENGAAKSDPEIRELLHHILLANRFWLCSILDVPFVLAHESRESSSLDALVQRYAAVHAPSGSPLIVMMQASQNRTAAKTGQGWCNRWRRTRWNRDLSIDPLMGACPVEVPDIRLDLPLQMMIAQDQNMV